MDEYGRGYGYSHHDNQFSTASDDSDSNQDDLSNNGKSVAATTADILQNFPYLKHGGLSQLEAASSTFQRPQMNQLGPRFPANYPDMGQLDSGMPIRPPSHGLGGFLQHLQMPEELRQSQQNTHRVELPSMQHFAAAYGNMARRFPAPNTGMPLPGRMFQADSTVSPIGMSIPTTHNTHTSDTYSFPHVDHHGHPQPGTVESQSIPQSFNHTSISFPSSTFDSSHMYGTSACVAQSHVAAANLDTSAVYSTSHTRTYPFPQPVGVETIPGRPPALTESQLVAAEPQNFPRPSETSNYESIKMEVKIESPDVATDLSAVKQLTPHDTLNYTQNQSTANFSQSNTDTEVISKLSESLSQSIMDSSVIAQLPDHFNQSNTDSAVSARLPQNTDGSVINNPVAVSVQSEEYPSEFKSKFAKAKDLSSAIEKPEIPKLDNDIVVKQETMNESVADTNDEVKHAIAEVIKSAKQRVKKKQRAKKKTPAEVPPDEPVSMGVTSLGSNHNEEVDDTVELDANKPNTGEGKVKFLYKGKLRKLRTTAKTVQAIMEEPVDSEDIFYENLEYYFPITKMAGWGHGKPGGQTGVDGESDDYASEGEITSGYRLPPTGNEMTDNWYSEAMKKYADLTDGNYGITNNSLKLNSMIKVGGRSDPDNPFAITSPSFSESAARGVVTTKQFATMTNVMISITSIGSRKKLIPTVVNSEAAEGGLVSVINPMEESEEKDTNEADNASECDADDIKTDKTSILSKLRREKATKAKEDEKDTDLDRLDINIRVDNDQCVTHGDQKRWACKLCYKSYTTKHNLVSHILDHTGIKPHLCLVCGKYFRQLSHLNTHMLTHDNVKPHTCDVCDKDFTQISHLKRHMTVHLDSKPYRCDVCMRGFTYPSELRSHREKHVPGKDKCTECGLECTGTRDLAQHMQTHDSRNNLMCNFCSRVFRFPAQLRDHMMSHSGARPYMCTECGMDFMKEHHLKAHQFTHSGLKPFACPFCSRAFNQKANMARHMLIHNAERAFVCPVCDKTFTQPQTLKAHMVVHEETKPYSCKYCGKQFGRLHNLQGHMHMHNDSKPYVCSICQSSFTLKGNLNRHKKVKHGLSESTEDMEEDAVNFLTSLSDRVRDHSASSDELDTSKDESSSRDKRSPKKGRKSTPRKHVSSKKDGEDTKFTESGTELDNDTDELEMDEDMIMISYSDEERENEARLQLKLLSSETSSSGKASQKKHKRGTSFKVGKSNGRDSDAEDAADNAGQTGEVDGDGEPNMEVVDNRDKTKPTAAKPEKRGRKRKKKSVIENDLYDEFEEAYTPQPTKSRKKKGDKLDSLIASKFKNIE